MRVSRSDRGLARSDASAPSPPTETRPIKRSRRRYAILGLVVVAIVGAYFLGRYIWAQNHLAAAERALEQRNFAEATARLDRCLSVRPDDSEARLLAVRIARRAGEDDKADTLARAYQKKFPSNGAIEREIHLLRTQQGSVADIDALLAEALARGDGADWMALEAALVGGVKLLLPAFMQGDTAPGGEAFPFLVKVQRGADLWLRLRPGAPDRAEGLVWRGLTRAYSSDGPGSVADFRAALALNSAHRDARLHLALALQQELPLEAGVHLQHLRELYPNDALVKFTLATVYRSTGRTEGARALLDEILAVEPNNLAVLIERGSLALDQGHLDRAEQLLVRAQKLAPDDARANFTLATCLRTAGRTDEAKTYHDRFLRIRDERRKQFDRAAPIAPGPPR